MSTSDQLDDCGALREHVETLTVMLACWGLRDDSLAQPEVRQAANSAVESIDAALATLHRIRNRLVGEIHESDDATMRRSGELLEQIRREREIAGGDQ